MAEVVEFADQEETDVVAVSPKARKADRFDQDSFNAIDYINEMFPTGETL